MNPVPQQPLVHQNPAVLAHLTILRDQTTGPEAFRAALHRVSLALAIEATFAASNVLTCEDTVETPLGRSPCHRFAGSVAIVPILRAALGMEEAFLTFLPHAATWHVDMERDPSTLQPKWGRNKTPQQVDPDTVVYVLDPMLATGGSASAVCFMLKERGASRIVFVGVLAAPEGIQRMATDHPDVAVIVAAMDERLNERGYIVPGLGDAGDRQFGTLHG